MRMSAAQQNEIARYWKRAVSVHGRASFLSLSGRRSRHKTQSARSFDRAEEDRFGYDLIGECAHYFIIDGNRFGTHFVIICILNRMFNEDKARAIHTERFALGYGCIVKFA